MNIISNRTLLFNLNTIKKIMSAEKSEKKNSERKEGERESVQAKASYT